MSSAQSAALRTALLLISLIAFDLNAFSPSKLHVLLPHLLVAIQIASHNDAFLA